jgi:hypothetical protein
MSAIPEFEAFQDFLKQLPLRHLKFDPHLNGKFVLNGCTSVWDVLQLEPTLLVRIMGEGNLPVDIVKDLYCMSRFPSPEVAARWVVENAIVSLLGWELLKCMFPNPEQIRRSDGRLKMTR